MATLSVTQRRTCLASCPLFAELSPDTLGVLAEAVVVEEFGQGEDVCLQGEPADCVYVVERGVLDVILPGREQPVRQLGRHDVFGEYGMFTGLRTSRIRAAAPTILLSMDYERFRALMHQFPSIMSGLLEAAVERLTKAEARS